MKEWGRFPMFKQEMLCRKYTVILTDWVPKRTRIINKVNSILDNTIKGIDKVSKGLEKLDGSKINIFQGVSQKEYNSLVGMPKKDYSALLGKPDKNRYKGLI